MLLNKIPGITAVIGPYYDTGLSLVIYNTNTHIVSVLKKIAKLRAEKDAIRAKIMNSVNPTKKEKLSKKEQEQLMIGYHNDENIKILNSQIHPLMGKLLGYPCELDLSAPGFYANQVYSIAYQIPEINYRFGFWCPLSAKKEVTQCITKLEIIKSAFDKLNMLILNRLELSIQVVEP
jgi:hypothetical protein